MRQSAAGTAHGVLHPLAQPSKRSSSHLGQATRALKRRPPGPDRGAGADLRALWGLAQAKGSQVGPRQLSEDPGRRGDGKRPQAHLVPGAAKRPKP